MITATAAILDVYYLPNTNYKSATRFHFKFLSGEAEETVALGKCRCFCVCFVVCVSLGVCVFCVCVCVLCVCVCEFCVSVSEVLAKLIKE
jgi:type III secretory pathway component EscU